MEKFDALIIGGGHAGIEAAWAIQKFSLKCALVTLEINAIGTIEIKHYNKLIENIQKLIV